MTRQAGGAEQCLFRPCRGELGEAFHLHRAAQQKALHLVAHLAAHHC